jgi:hypothetical protein
MEDKEWPEWARYGEADKYGNVVCKTCENSQSPTFRACIYCCPHNELEFVEEWHGPVECGGWELGAECAICGKNFDFPREQIMQEYKAIRKPTVII